MLSFTHVCNRMIFVRARGKNCKVVIWRQTSMCTNDIQEFEFRMHRGGDIFMPMCTVHTVTSIVVSCHRFSFTPSNQFLLLCLQFHVRVIYFKWSNLLFVLNTIYCWIDLFQFWVSTEIARISTLNSEFGRTLFLNTHCSLRTQLTEAVWGGPPKPHHIKNKARAERWSV